MKRAAAGVDRRVEVAERELGGEEDRDGGQDRGDPEALVHRAHDARALAEADEVGADDRGDDAHAADQQRQAHQREQAVAARCVTSKAVRTIVAPTVTT